MLLQQKNHFEPKFKAGVNKLSETDSFIRRKDTLISGTPIIRSLSRRVFVEHRNHFGYALIMAYLKAIVKKKIKFVDLGG